MSVVSDTPPPSVTTLVNEVPRLLSVVMLGGATAGAAVDIVLFPLDTVKTRLQSQYGFWKSGGFKGMYKGIGPTGIGSPISAGLFFGTYDTVKTVLSTKVSAEWYPCIHMFSASVAEVVSCTAKVPMEIVKQRRQASYRNLSAVKILANAVKQEGFCGLYRGFGSTVIRDVPFSLIEFPIWEWMKKEWRMKVDRELTATEVAACGVVGGFVAAAITTPLDVVKTQIMLADNCVEPTVSPSVVSILRSIYQQHGITKLFAGFLPRISLIMLGGGIFFGVYEKSCRLIEQNLLEKVS